MAESDRELLNDLYYRHDYPVLLEIGRWVEAGHPDGSLHPGLIARRLGRPPADVQAAVGRLWRDGKIDVADGSSPGEEAYMIRRMLSPGLRETGLWRDADDLADRLQRFLNAQAAAAEGSDPEQAHKIRRWAGALVDLGVRFAAMYSAELSKP